MFSEQEQPSNSLPARRYAARDAARVDLFDYIDVFYNRSRRHSTLGHQSPQHSITTHAVPKLAA